MSWIVGAIKGALGGIWGYLAAGIGILLTLLGLLSKAKKAGRDEVIAKTKEKEVENVKKAAKVEREVSVTKPSDIQRKLRDKYQRD